MFGVLNALNLQLQINPTDGLPAMRSHKVPVLTTAGEPMLAFYPVRILLPFGNKVSGVRISMSLAQPVAANVEIDFAKQQQPTSQPKPDYTIKNADIYNSDAFFPGKAHDYYGIQTYRGYSFAVINVYPWQYKPQSKELYASQYIDIEIDSEFDMELAMQQANFVTSNQSTVNDVQSYTQHNEAMSSYNAAATFRNVSISNRLIDLSSPKKMIIITDAVRAPWFSQYVAWRNSMGVSTALYLTNDIYQEYGGVDNADKVRNFIIHAYQSWANTTTPLEYVILGGDDEIVPERGARGQVGQTIDLRMPTDIYFSCLDGNWNANGNTIYGEVADNADLIPEVHIGRFSAETQQEFDNIFRKTRHYVENTTFAGNVALMIGENLNWNPVTWGGDYKDDVATRIPNNYNLQTIYQRDGTYSGTAVWNAINNGVNVINHMGHANESSLMGQAINTVNSMNNTQYGFLYSQGCYPAAFDQRTSGDGECIGEHFAMASSALFAFIGNTRYGWYMPGSIEGASQFYDREFFSGMFEHAHTQLGKALTYSRVANINHALSSDVMRWCYYEVVLFGDPSIEVKYPDPMMPYLALEEYYISDIEGDGDGTLNPGEIIRIYPRISNHAQWHAAENVSLSLSDLPNGCTLLSEAATINQILPGQLNSDEVYFRVQLGTNLSFGDYTFKLSIDASHPQTGASVGVRTFPITMAITLLDNRFPWESIYATKSSPLVYDFNADGDNDILYLDVFGSAHFIGSNGSEYANVNTTATLNVNRSYAFADIDGDGVNDLAISSRSGDVLAMRIDGTPIFSFHADTQFLGTPVIGDVNGDGSADVVAIGMNRNVYVFNADGSLQAGFPFEVNGTVPGELALADLNNNGSKEIICGTVNGTLYAIASGGLLHPGFPLELGASLVGSPVVLDNNRIVCNSNNWLYLVENSGAIVFQKAIASDFAGGAVIADINWDNNLDIIGISTVGTLYVVDQQGNDLPGFPVQIGEFFTCPPLIADIGGGQRYEIILQSYINAIHIYNHDGSVHAGFPFPIAFNGSTPATLSDFDSDGHFKLIAGYSNGILLINLRRNATVRTPWTVYRGSLDRQASFAATGYVSNEDSSLLPAVTSLEQNYPNPFNPTTTISYTLAENSNVALEIFNLKGQRIRVLRQGKQNAGKHQLLWNGTDDKGMAVGSGIYLYKLHTGKFTSSKKMILMK